MDSFLLNDPHLVALNFKPEQLARARELRGLTKNALAKLINKTPSALTQFESGIIKPDSKTVARLALALNIPVAFFSRRPFTTKINMEDCHFRSLRSVSQYLRRQALRIGEVVREISIFLEKEGVEFPKEEISQLKASANTFEDIEHLATYVRRSWGLGLGPIHRVIPLLESKGIRILPLVDACKDVDAFSFWQEGIPVVMLAMNKNNSHTHFDAAHELGHLIMHEDVSPADPPVEKEADHFASAFLMPKETFLSECPRRWSLPVFRALKRRWRVSIRALVYRAHKLGCLSPASYKRAYMELNKLYGRTEPDEWILEPPIALKKALELVAEDFSIERISEELGLHKRTLEEIL